MQNYTTFDSLLKKVKFILYKKSKNFTDHKNTCVTVEKATLFISPELFMKLHTTREAPRHDHQLRWAHYSDESFSDTLVPSN